MSQWSQLNVQMARYSERLTTTVKLSPQTAAKLATTVAAEVRFLPQEGKLAVSHYSPVPLADRLSELQAFEGWAKFAQGFEGNPFLTRAHVLTQNYVCFVYLPEGCFQALRKYCPDDSATKKCAKFLTDNPVRAFRNAIAHANWRYRQDFRGILFWARKGSDTNVPMEQFEVGQEELDFWQALSRCVAYVAYSNL